MKTPIAIVIPSQGHRPTLRPLLREIREALADPDFVLVALNSPSATVISLPQHEVIRVPNGYSSSRNAAAIRAIELGAKGIIFIDDDVVLRSADVRRFVNIARRTPSALISFPVEKRLSPDAGPLARHILQAKIIEGQNPQVLPATFLHVPSAAFDRTRFPESLDFTGAEDTLFTQACRQNGFDLVRMPWVGPYETHDSTRTTPSELVARMIASKTAIRLDKSCPAMNWTLTLRMPGYALLSSAIGAASWAHPLLPYYLGAAIARILAFLHLLPVKEVGRWRAFRLIKCKT